MAPYFRILFLSILAAGSMSHGVSAHHSFDGEFDRDKPITLTGTLTKVQWTNPHGRLLVDVKEPTGGVTTWEVQLGSVNILVRNGWAWNSIKVGEVVTVAAFLARDTPHLVGGGKITLADGKKWGDGVFTPAPPIR